MEFYKIISDHENRCILIDENDAEKYPIIMDIYKFEFMFSAKNNQEALDIYDNWINEN